MTGKTEGRREQKSKRLKKTENSVPLIFEDERHAYLLFRLLRIVFHYRRSKTTCATACSRVCESERCACVAPIASKSSSARLWSMMSGAPASVEWTSMSCQ